MLECEPVLDASGGDEDEELDNEQDDDEDGGVTGRTKLVAPIELGLIDRSLIAVATAADAADADPLAIR